MKTTNKASAVLLAVSIVVLGLLLLAILFSLIF